LELQKTILKDLKPIAKALGLKTSQPRDALVASILAAEAGVTQQPPVAVTQQPPAVAPPVPSPPAEPAPQPAPNLNGSSPWERGEPSFADMAAGNAREQAATTLTPEAQTVASLQGIHDMDGNHIPLPSPEASGGDDQSKDFIVLFDTHFEKRPLGLDGVQSLAEYIDPIAKEVARQHKVEHFGCIDYGKGGAFLAAAVDKVFAACPPQGIITVDSNSLCGRALKDVLIKYAKTAMGANR